MLIHIPDVIAQIQFLVDEFLYGPNEVSWTAIGTLVVAFVFFLVGIFRFVEFDGLGLTKTRRSILIALHVVGCLFFSMALALQAIDIEKSQNNLVLYFLFAGLGLLFPVHIYTGLLRRVRLRDQQNQKSNAR